jgi:hypothetical protein
VAESDTPPLPGLPEINIRVVPGLPANQLWMVSPRLDQECVDRACGHVHEKLLLIEDDDG